VPTEVQIHHLFKRAGFGADLATIQAKAAQPLADTVNELLDDVVDVTRPAFLDDDIGDWEKEYALKAWWYDRMATSTTPLQEKLTLFWHGHFATENAKVADMRLMWDQNNLFRTSCMGNFRQLVRDMSLQPAMLVYLDGAYNHRYSPNENFARELMELFTLGVNQYSQNDIVASARAWTGHNIDDDVQPYTYEFRSEAHDSGNKTFMGQSRAWNGPEIIDFILQENAAKKAVAAKYMTRKFWTFFAGSTPTSTMIDELAQVFLDNDLDVKELLRAMFQRSEFYNSWSRLGLVRSPVEWVVAIMKATGLPMTEPGGDLPHFNLWGIDETGMDLFQPPNVAGWKNNAYWLGTTQYWARGSWIWNYRWTLHEADFLMAEVQDVLDGAGGDARYAVAVDNALAKFGVYFPSDNTRNRLISWVKKQYETPGEWSHYAWYYITQLVTLSPDFMMA
jgi:uncharacterized protein (DUF1800 family)